jgi:tetratricopeptide (TPR) repeat protein
MKMAKDQQLEVNPNPLEVHADTVKFDVAVTLPVKMLKPGLVYGVDIKYAYADKEVKMDRVEIKADDYPSADTQAPRIAKDFVFPYNDEMGTGSLMLQGVGIDPKKGKESEPQPEPALEIAKGIITTSRLVASPSYSAMVSYDYKDADVNGWTPDEELEPTNVNIFFAQGSSVLRSSERDGKQGKFFQAFVAEKNVTRTVTITGTHSPEGAERINSRLSEDRANVIEDWYRKMMKKYDYKGAADSINFILKPVIEDWTEFKAAINEYEGIDQDQKNEILNVVNGAGTFEEKEDALHKLASYKNVFKDVYPGLRTAQTQILTVIEKRSDAEISMLAKQIAEGSISADTLSYGELAYAAYLTPSLKEKAGIYEATVKVYSNWAAHNNLGAVYLAMAAAGEGEGNLDKATTQFEISNNKKQNAYATGNLGVAEFHSGNTAKGYADISKAVGMSLPSKDVYGFNGVKGAIEIKAANYDIAVKTLSNSSNEADNLFNKGLAQVLSGDNQNALTTLDELADKDADYALGHYVAAIASARANNADDAVAHLTEAVSSDASLKAKALTDLEFRNISGSDAFQNALK